MSTEQDINELFAAQKQWFQDGNTRDIAVRMAALRRFRQVILDNKPAIYAALESDLGKTPDIVDLAEIGAVVEEIDSMLAGLPEWSQDQVFPLEGVLAGSEGRIRAEPYGVSYVIGPFNYPFNLTLTPLAGIIAAGNTAILKPSEATPATSGVIRHIIEQAFPAHYVSVVEGARHENELLLAKPFDFIFFTGSPGVGKVVMKAAAEHLAPVVLELGGKCPVVVLEDADIPHLTERLCFAKYLNSGQTCVAPDYLLVPESLQPQVMQQLTLALEKLQGENIGKVVSEKQIDKLAGYLATTRGQLVSGGTYDKSTRQFAPTLVSDVSWDDALMQEEIFGPILPVVSYRDLAECREKIIQYHEKPLALYVFSQDTDRALEFINSVQSGDAQINDALSHVLSTQLPFGGIGPSGMGKYHGKASFTTCSHQRSIRTLITG